MITVDAAGKLYFSSPTTIHVGIAGEVYSLCMTAGDTMETLKLAIDAQLRARLAGGRCDGCGRLFSLSEGLIPYHDDPPPCRCVCRGSRKPPV